MADYGTAPRKIKGVWYTSNGRRLSEAGQRYWDRQVGQGRFDVTGHRVQRALATQPSAKATAPNLTLSGRTGPQLIPQVPGAVGLDFSKARPTRRNLSDVDRPGATPQQIRQQEIHQKSQQAGREASAIRDQLLAARGYDQPVFPP